MNSHHQHENATIAENYVDACISVIPLRLDGSKAPSIAKWKEFQSRIAEPDEISAWFARNRNGIGVVCGVVSGGLEVLDFDERPDETFSAWRDLLSSEIRSRLCVCETGGAGYHVIYRCDEVCGNTKIAMSEERSVLVESRGEGGYIVAVGSPLEVHSDRMPYVQVSGVPLPEIPRFTCDERRLMWERAASFDQRDQMQVVTEFAQLRANEMRPTRMYSSNIDQPWDDFDSRANWSEILIPAGWNSPDGISWSRPAKDFGTSAKVATAESGNEVLVVFSTNAGPLSPVGFGHKTWGKFSAYAALYHANDRSLACKAIRQLGYGRNNK